jgi:transcriptional regulator with XRE-family HTH domain
MIGLREAIRVLLARKNISQKELAQGVGISPANLSTIINGKKDPSMDFLVRCKEYFELDNAGVIEFFKAALSSSKVISIDTSYISSPYVRGRLVDILASIILFPDMGYSSSATENFEESVESMIEHFNYIAPSKINPLRKDTEKK